MRPVAYRQEARSEIGEGYDWYESQRKGLGLEFTNEIRDAVRRIASNPRLYAKVNRHLYAARVHRFPYVVYYVIRKQDVLIIGVRHGARSTRCLGKRA